MKSAIFATLIFLAASAAGCATERSRVLYRRHAGYDSNYCHEKILMPADPLSNSRDVVDYYGACGEGP